MKRLWVILLLFSQPFSQTTVAVLEFETEGLDNISSSALSSIVRREVRNNKEYRLIDRNMMKAVLEEQGFQQSGCVSSECAVQVGELLGVQKMVTGTISALGSLYLVEILILDVGTGLIEKSEMFEHVGRVEELIKPLRDYTKKLFGGKSSDLIENTFLYIESEPVGGMVYIDNNNIGSSPIKYKVKPGDYKVTVKTQGYQDWMQIVSVELGENKVLMGTLVKNEPTQGISAGGSGIGEWVFWGISQQDYIRLMQLNITKLEWSETFQPNNLTVEIIDDYKSLKFPKHLWVTIYKTNVPTNIANLYNQWSIPIDRWSNLYNSEFGKIPINIASKYFQWSIPFDDWSDTYQSGVPIDIAQIYYQWSIPYVNWSDTYQSGLNVEQIRSLENNHNLNILDLIGYFKQIKYFGFDNVQTVSLETKYLKWNLNFNEIIFSKAKLLNNITVDEFIEKVSSIEGGNDIFFTNSIAQLNKKTQIIVFDYFDEAFEYDKLNVKINNFRSDLYKSMKKQVSWKYLKPLSENLSIGNLILLRANNVSNADVANLLRSYSKFIFSE